MKTPIFLMVSVFIFFMVVSAELKASQLTAKIKSKKDFIRFGLASFYHAGLKGFETFNGEHYNGAMLTGAHKTLPMGTTVRVTDLRTKRSVIVRINDRLPKTSKRMIDLSRTAAGSLHMISRGIAKVKLEVVLKNRLTVASL